MFLRIKDIGQHFSWNRQEQRNGCACTVFSMPLAERGCVSSKTNNGSVTGSKHAQSQKILCCFRRRPRFRRFSFAPAFLLSANANTNVFGQQVASKSFHLAAAFRRPSLAFCRSASKSLHFAAWLHFRRPTIGFMQGLNVFVQSRFVWRLERRNGSENKAGICL